MPERGGDSRSKNIHYVAARDKTRNISEVVHSVEAQTESPRFAKSRLFYTIPDILQQKQIIQVSILL